MKKVHLPNEMHGWPTSPLAENFIPDIKHISRKLGITVVIRDIQNMY
jgi:hypothetical protein